MTSGLPSQIEFALGEPFQPFNQLMGVLPAGSKHALPEALQPLFEDPNSPILDFYPKDFKVDMNGKRFAWQGVALLPFIDESRLLEATKPIIDQLPPAERRRNEQYVSTAPPAIIPWAIAPQRVAVEPFSKILACEAVTCFRFFGVHAQLKRLEVTARP
jgi:hypothetical protein